MKRDMDLIRQILFKVEAAQTFNQPVQLKIDGYAADLIAFHVRLLADGGIIEAYAAGGNQWWPTALTWSGCEFIDAARDDTNWEKAKTVLSKAGGITFETIMPVLVGLILKNLP
jgi:hypothetical protein